MRYIKTHEGFFDFFRSEKSKIKRICEEYGIVDWSINSDGLVDVNGHVYLENMNLTKLPLKFGVTGDFNCSDNRLTSLEGAPHTVGNFRCDENLIKSLEEGPTKVNGYFSCDDNDLRSLKGCPKEVKFDFYCGDNQIKTFDGLCKIGGNFFCSNNPINEIWEIISEDCKWDNNIMDLFFEYDSIREEGIVLDRFNDFLEEIGLEPVESVWGYYNL